jgi:GNAT superfamily N-acetyltransferase
MTSIRPATDADMGPVADLWHQGWHDGHAGHVPEGLTAARTLTAFHERTPSRVADTSVAVDVAGELLGFVMVVGDEVEQVFVAPGARGTGTAADLLAEAEHQVFASGHEEAWLAVVAGNSRARRFYEKHGWLDTGDLPYEVVAGGATYVSPCRRYAKRCATGDVTDLDHATALCLGGWDPRYAVVLATAARDGVAAAVVDTNGDGADIDLDQYEQAPDGRWAEVASGNCGESGAFATGFMAIAWGQVEPGATVKVEFLGAAYLVDATDQGWWMFVIPSRSGDVPTVAAQGLDD